MINSINLIEEKIINILISSPAALAAAFEIIYFDKEILKTIGGPLEQFEVIYLLYFKFFEISYQISLTNIGFYIFIAGLIILKLSLLATNYNKVVSNFWSISQESIYFTILSIVVSQIFNIRGQTYFPFMYTLFVFILVNNLIGMVPFSFAVTGHFATTFALSSTVVLGATILGGKIQGVKFFAILVPRGCPIALLPLLIIIEFISYIARAVSLGLRLGANIVSGHMLLSILSGFTYLILLSMTSTWVESILPLGAGLVALGFVISFTGLEIGIAVIQAQVFTVLSSSYMKDGLDLH